MRIDQAVEKQGIDQVQTLQHIAPMSMQTDTQTISVRRAVMHERGTAAKHRESNKREAEGTLLKVSHSLAAIRTNRDRAPGPQPAKEGCRPQLRQWAPRTSSGSSRGKSYSGKGRDHERLGNMVVAHTRLSPWCQNFPTYGALG